MTRILVQRGSTGSSSNPNRSASSSGSSSSSRSEKQVSNDSPQVVSVVKNEEISEEMHEQTTVGELVECPDSQTEKSRNVLMGSNELVENDGKASGEDGEGFEYSGRPIVSEKVSVQVEGLASDPPQCGVGSPCPLPPSISLQKSSSVMNLETRRSLSGSCNNARAGAQRRGIGSRPIVSTRSSPTGSRPSSPRSYGESEGYNSADEQNPCFGSSYCDMERERQFEIDIRRAKNLEVRRMSEDGNCLFRAVADQVYGDSEAYDLTRQMCMDYMEQERDHFSQFITEGFTSYCKRKRRDQVYGNNVEIQALAEMYNRPIHIYSYSTEPINTFHGHYNTDTPPIRLSYHHGNHYNSLVDPRRLTVGAGLGFSSLQGRNVDKEQVKAAIKAQQDQQIDNALVAEGQFYSDLEITEKEIEQMVMEASRAEYLAKDKYKPQLGIGLKDSSTSAAEPSSSGARASGSATSGREQRESRDPVLSSSVQMILSMGFSYLQAIEAFSIFGDDVDSMVCYLLETGSSSRRKGKKATE